MLSNKSMAWIAAILAISPCVFAQPGAAQLTRNTSVRYASDFPGADVGEQIGAAYADLPATGGAIIVYLHRLTGHRHHV
jgi:hypothetical protein